jgi:hypothetical protein
MISACSRRELKHSDAIKGVVVLLASLVIVAALLRSAPTLSRDVDVTPYVGNMWWISESWISRNGINGMHAWFDKAGELYIKVVHMNVMLWAGVTYTSDETFYCFGGIPMSKTLIRGAVQLAHDHGMKAVAYANFWCERSVAYSKYQDSIFYYKGREVEAYKSDVQDTIIMDMDPDKSFGKSMLEQLKGVLDDWWFDGVEYDGVGIEMWLNCGDARGWVTPEDPTPLAPGIIEFLSQAKAIANSKGKVVMGNSPRSPRVQPVLDLVMNALDSVGNTLSARKVGYDGSWCDYFRDHLQFRFDQLIYTAWEPRGYQPTALTRDEFLTFFHWCLTGDCFMSPRWNDDLEDCYANKDLFQIYTPYIIDDVMTKLGSPPNGNGSANGWPQIPGDINADGKVNLLDISIAAIALQSYPGHSRWNPKADINGDDTINILDIAYIAREYGKAAAQHS